MYVRHPARRRLLLLLLLLVAGELRGQGLISLSGLDDAGFPVMSAGLYALDGRGALIHSLDRSDVVMRENGVEVEVLDVSCPPVPPPAALSSVLMIDISGSMNFGGPNIDIARTAARTWIEALPLGLSECAVASFDDRSYLNQDFTTDRERLLDAVARLTPEGGTNYDAGLVDLPAGAIPIAVQGRHKRIVVFLTDGVGNGTEERIVAQALAADVTVYCVTIGLATPPILKNVAERTGGLWFERVTSAAEAAQIYRMILNVAQGARSCTITWRGNALCGPLRVLDVEIPGHGLRDTFYFPNAHQVSTHLEFTPPDLSFGGVGAGAYEDRTITITARDNPVVLDGIVPDDPRFTIVAGAPAPGQVLQVGQSIEVTVRYTPTDSGFVFATLQVASSACPGSIPSLVAGFPGKRPSTPTLKVVRPNGGEELPIGADTVIRWSGLPADEPVRLEYSTDDGATWNLIDEQATGPEYAWQVPPTPSRRCLLRVAQFDGGGGVLTLSGHSLTINSAAFSPDGARIATCSDDGSVIIWDAFTGARILILHPGTEPGGRPGGVRSVQFSRDGGSLLVAGRDGIIRIYDVATGDVLRQIPAPSGVAAGAGAVARFSPDGTLIAAGYIDGTLALFESAGVLRYSLKAHSSPIADITFSPDGDYMATGGGTDGVVATWEVAGGGAGPTFSPQPKGYARRGIWTPDQSRFITVSDRVLVYKWPSGDYERTIAEQIYDAMLNADGTRIVTGDWHTDSARLSIYDLATGDIVQGFAHEQEGGVYVVRFSADGGRVLGTGLHNEAKVWDLDGVPLQQDVSDSLWAIVHPVAAGGDLDLGRVVVGASRDSVVAGYLCNDGDGPLAVRSIAFAGDAAAEFQVVSGDAPFVLGPGECRAVEFRFAPVLAGTRSATVVLATAVDTLRYAIRGEGVRRMLEAVTGIVDFGGVRLGDMKDETVDVIIRNTGSDPVTITGTEILGPDLEQFEVLAGGGSFVLEAGESHGMRLRFAPLRTGRTLTRLAFFFDEPGSPLEALLFGEGLCAADGASHAISLGIGTMEAVAGDTITLPLLLRNASGMPPVAGSYTMGVRFNRHMLFPLNSGFVRTLVDGDTLFRYHGVWDGAADTLAVFRFIAALGDAVETEVTIESFRWEWACPVDITRESSAVRVNVCTEGEQPRLFLDAYDLALKPLRPNPSRGVAELEITVSAGGVLRMYLIDPLGRNVRTVFDAELSAGMHTLPVDLEGIPAGRYVYVVETATARRTGVMELVR